LTGCSDPAADGTAVTFPTDAVGLGEVTVAASPSGQGVEFHGTGSPVLIAGTVDPASFDVQFDLRDEQGKGIHCTGVLQKFVNPSGAEGMTTRADCDAGSAGAAECRLDPPVKASLLIQRILPEGTPSP
jgi:hypothetical protein